MIERARSHLYIRLKTEQPDHLVLYKIEISTMENFKRIHNQLCNISKLILNEPAKYETPISQDNATIANQK